MDWEANKSWSDRFIPQIKQIIGGHLLSAAPMQEDAERNTDLIVLNMNNVRIACRVRKHDYFVKYPNEFTVRSYINGHKTELWKIVEGWGQYFFYGFCDAEESQIIAWRLIDLNAFRLWLFTKAVALYPSVLPGEEKDNFDGTKFRVFDVRDFSGYDLVVVDHGF